MENNKENTQHDKAITTNAENNPKIYSNKAIYLFSFLFSPIFGGVLLMQNLRDVGKKEAGFSVLGLSVLFTIAAIVIVNNQMASQMVIICNVAGGFILSNPMYKKHFPNDEDYKKKDVWKPLIISILITVPFILALIYGE